MKWNRQMEQIHWNSYFFLLLSIHLISIISFSLSISPLFVRLYPFTFHASYKFHCWSEWNYCRYRNQNLCSDLLLITGNENNNYSKWPEKKKTEYKQLAENRRANKCNERTQNNVWICVAHTMINAFCQLYDFPLNCMIMFIVFTFGRYHPYFTMGWFFSLPFFVCLLSFSVFTRFNRVKCHREWCGCLWATYG